MNFHSKFEDRTGALRKAHLLLQFNELQDRIYNGQEIPDDFYRLDVDQNRDRLLHETGIKHLHLGGRTSNDLVYLIELADRVIILLIATHAYLEDEPRGSTLREILGLPPDWPFGHRS